MSYFSLRLTIEKINTSFSLLLLLIKTIICDKLMADTWYAAGLEELNKFGEKTLKHIHFNFQCEDNKETLRTWLVRKAGSLGFKLKGKESYCLQQFPQPEDYERWIRYPLKECTKPLVTNIPAQDLTKLQLCAKDERARSIKHNIEKREYNNQKNTYFDKICEDLDKKSLKTHRSIYIEICKKYVADKKPLNHSTIAGYTNIYMLQKSLITFDAFYDKNFKC